MAGDRWVFDRGTVEFSRAIGMIDAIFGFSLTLLVTTLDVPPAEAWVSLRALLGSGLGDQLFAFVISFVVVVGFWFSNHQALSSFRALDGATIRVCIYLVGLVIFVPFTTKVISGANPAHLPLPTAIYAVNVAAIVFMTVVLVVVGRAWGLAERSAQSDALIVHSLAVGLVFLASIPVAYRFGSNAAMWSWLSLVVITPAVGFAARRSRPR